MSLSKCGRKAFNPSADSVLVVQDTFYHSLPSGPDANCAVYSGVISSTQAEQGWSGDWFTYSTGECDLELGADILYTCKLSYLVMRNGEVSLRNSIPIVKDAIRKHNEICLALGTQLENTMRSA